MTTFADLAIMSVGSAPGTGSTIALGSAATINGVAYLTFAAAGITNGTVVDYSLLDPTNGGSEMGSATYSSTGPQLTGRTPTVSTAGTGVAINASIDTIVRLSPRAETLQNATNLFITGTVPTARLGSGAASSTTALFGDQTYKTITTNGLVLYQFLTSSQTITIPAGATRATIRMVGSGGGGGGGKGVISGGCSCTFNFGIGAGGGAGAALRKFLTGLTPGNTLVFTLGAAGTAGAATPTAGGSAGTTTLASGTQTISTLTCPGGVGGGNGNGGRGGSTQTTNASGGDINLQPQFDYQTAVPVFSGTQNLSQVLVFAGQASADGWGPGGVSRGFANSAGAAPASGFGGGGSPGMAISGVTGFAGGAGLVGALEIYWWS